MYHTHYFKNYFDKKRGINEHKKELKLFWDQNIQTVL